MNKGRDIKFFTKTEILDIHNKMVFRHCDKAGVGNEKKLDEIVNRPFKSRDFSEMKRVDVPTFAARYLYHFVKSKPFVSGNKRTALMVSLIFVRLNGARINPELGSRSLIRFVSGVSNETLNIDELVKMFKKFVVLEKKKRKKSR